MPDTEHPPAFECLRLALILLALAGGVAVGGAKERGKVPPPVFSVAGGVFTNDITLRLSPPPPATSLRFTFDGSEPAEMSPVFTGPIVITNNTLVRARAFAPEHAPGAVVSHTYVLLDPELLGFNSNLPLIVINAFGKEVPHEEKALAAARFIELKDGRATLLGAGSGEAGGLFNMRGRPSLRYPKRSYTFKTVDEDDEPLKVPLLGLPKESDWILYAPYPDKTLMRDVLAYEMSNQLGRWAPRTVFVEVFVNEAGGRLSSRDYLGVYVFEEKVKRDKSRVNIEKLDCTDNAEPNVSGGYIFKKDHRTGDLGPITVNPGGFPTMTGSSSSVRPGFPTGPGGFPGDPAGFQPSYQGTLRTVSSSSSSRPTRVTRGVITNHVGAPTPRAAVARNRVVMRMDDDEYDSSEDDRFHEGFHTTRTNHLYFVEPEPDEITAVQRA